MRLPEIVRSDLRARAVLLFACVLALETADATAVGATGPQLEGALHISNTQLGLLAAISTLVGALGTLPAGVLADRVYRVRLLAVAVALWGVSMVASAVAQDYAWLLLSRVGLGAVAAAAAPVIASLTGDFFPPAERARIYGYILSGELLGAGVGFVVCGSIAGALSWRWAFVALAIPAAALAVVLWTRLPEPPRGRRADTDPPAADSIARRAVRTRAVRPVSDRVLRRDPAGLGLRDAVRYVLCIPTNRWLIAASSIGYFFFAGMRTFGVVFVRGHFGLPQATAVTVLFVAGLGSLAGVLTSGRLADRLTARGMPSARIVVGAVSYFIASIVLLPALLVGSVGLALPLLAVAAAGLAAPNPPLDAARLDIMPSGLWGRAEGVRTMLRQTAQAAAPLVFGFVADALGGTGGSFGVRGAVSPASAHALDITFLIMLLPLAANGGLLLCARRTYAADVATAVASEAASRR
jgi:predicted MFS family arabinose efflux permease